MKEHREELAAERSNTSATSGEANPILLQGTCDDLGQLAVMFLEQRGCKAVPLGISEVERQKYVLGCEAMHLQELEPLV